MVTSFTRLLQLRYLGKLDSTADEYIRLASDGARRMHNLIDDLLAFSRVDHAEPAFSVISADAPLDIALDALRASIEESGAGIIREPLPEVRANAKQLAQVFQNLIGNSIKYRGDKKPDVRIGAVAD